MRPNQTVVIYMGLAGLDAIFGGLVRHGLSPGYACRAHRAGHDLRAGPVHAGTVGTLPAIVERERPRAPTLVIVGEVVRLREKLAWYHPSRSAESAFVPRPPGGGPESG